MKRKNLIHLICVAAILLAAAVPGMGNDCSSALSYGQINDPPQNGSIVSSGEQWYSFTGPDDMIVTVSLCGSAFDTKLEVWYSCADGTYAFYNDDSCGTQSEISSIPFVSGSTHFVKVYGYGSASGSFTLDITGVLDLAPDPVTAFPFTEDFESGSFPATIVPNAGSHSDLSIDTYAGYNSTYGAMFEGNTSTAWGSTPNNVNDAFAKTDHVAKMKMVVEPTGQSNLKLEFDLVQRYSFNTNYEWFRVLVNGVPVPDEDGKLYHQASSATGDAWGRVVYDLSAYQGLGSFDLTFENAAKYYFEYYQDGDLGCVDNINLYYLNIGDVEGYVFNGDGLSIAGADVWMDGFPVTQTDVTGYYFLSQVKGLDQDVNAWKDGYNLTTDNFYITPGGTTTHDFTLTKPGLTINPIFFDETLDPGADLTTYLGILNTGDGESDWEAVINYPPGSGLTGWLTLSDDNGTVPGKGGSQNVVVNFDAAGTAAGEVYTAEIEITTDPDVGTFVIPVTMTIVDTSPPPVPDPPTPPSITINPLFFYETIDPDKHLTTYLGILNTGDNEGNWEAVVNYTSTGNGPTGWLTLSEVDGTIPGKGGSQNVGVSFDANGTTAGDVYTAEIEITTNPDVGTFVVPVIMTIIDPSTPPSLTINPLFFYETADPDKHLTTYLGILNTGDNEGNWEAVVNYPSAGNGLTGWLTLSNYYGTLPGKGGSQNIGVNFDAAGTAAGNVYTAEIEITTDPDVGTFVVPVKMTIYDDPLDPAADLEADFKIKDMVTGQVDLTWQFSTFNPTFRFFEVVRDGVTVGTTTDLFYTDMLPLSGTYCYEVIPVYSEGNGGPAGPECVGDNQSTSAGGSGSSGGGECFIRSLFN